MLINKIFRPNKPLNGIFSYLRGKDNETVDIISPSSVCDDYFVDYLFDGDRETYWYSNDYNEKNITFDFHHNVFYLTHYEVQRLSNTRINHKNWTIYGVDKFKYEYICEGDDFPVNYHNQTKLYECKSTKPYSRYEMIFYKEGTDAEKLGYIRMSELEFYGKLNPYSCSIPTQKRNLHLDFIIFMLIKLNK